MITVSLIINGKKVDAAVEGRLLLSTFLREELRLTGTHIGCDTTQCGACTVLLNGQAVKSCTLLVAQADACELTTIEGVASEGRLHPIQQAFMDHHALQCGYCTPGFIMIALDLIANFDDLDDAKVRELIDGNLCRCTGYNNIVEAILAVARDAGSGRPTAEDPTSDKSTVQQSHV